MTHFKLDKIKLESLLKEIKGNVIGNTIEENLVWFNYRESTKKFIFLLTTNINGLANKILDII